MLTCEEHQRGGFGNIVAGVVCGEPLAFDSLGVEDRFGESGKPWELMVRLGLSAEHIATKAKRLVEVRKGGRAEHTDRRS